MTLTLILYIFMLISFVGGKLMAGASKNSRTTVATHKFFCSCGGEVVMKTLFESGKLKNVAECTKCKRVERRPKDFK
ncbi:MAG: hypothetical protein J5798_03570 [Spirochaetaceae bacterium]|nr:hypothetical protein [Spirochaetaceae bacterium]MBO4729811.1 hypothetical protein [Spirochaetaceae bacterium]MBR4824858.1 hypothetical protein [Spirochaetaceae bacterium]